MLPAYEIGQAVRLTRNVRNDGTYPGMDTGEMLIKSGSVGYVQNVGTFLQDQIIYSVHFIEDNKVIGCREQELIKESDYWQPCRFEFRDKVTSNKVLTVNGEVIARPGDVAEVLKVINEPTKSGELAQDEQVPVEALYHVRFPGRTLQVAESLLEPGLEVS
ncbi:NifZ protein [hydrothermal vent metagenome]|uniref:NifZ protein n=1 Tax=hydrothermal vent metagenome TaxID=652676 RepID=A0A3B0X6U4_9ZZZZ